MAAILFGSISTVADTSELQRESFNEAFAAHGLDWRWERDDYLAMLERSGGKDRVAAYAELRGEQVDAEAIHTTKSEIFQKRLADGIEPRAGVVQTVEAARRDGIKLGLVTTTSPGNVRALTEALRGTLDLAAFDVVVDAGQVDQVKPSPSAYAFALQELEVPVGEAVAIEDNVGGVQAATSAGLVCVAFPNSNTAGHTFDRATSQVDHLDPTQLIGLATSA